MGIYCGNEKGVLFFGDCRPAELYFGTQKITGYAVLPLEGESLTASPTYKDGLTASVCGKSVQETSVQGQNLLDVKKVPALEKSWPTQTGIAVNGYGVSVISHGDVIKFLKPGTTYYCKALLKYLEGAPEGYGSEYVSMLKALRLASLGEGRNIDITVSDRTTMAPGESHLIQSTFTTPDTLYTGDWKIIGFSESHHSESDAADIKHGKVEFAELMLSQSDLPYAPFVPKSPSPGYPSAAQSASEPVLTITGQDDSTFAAILETLRGISLREKDTKYTTTYTDHGGTSWVADEIKVDALTGTVTKIQRIGEIVLTGKEANWNLGAATNGIKRAFSYSVSIGLSDSHNADPGLCSHFGVNSSGSNMVESCTLGYNNRYLYLYVDSEQFSDVESLKTWLAQQYQAGTPVTVQYILETPLETDVTATSWGQALLALETKPYETQIDTVADMHPYIKAKIKIMEE